MDVVPPSALASHSATAAVTRCMWAAVIFAQVWPGHAAPQARAPPLQPSSQYLLLPGGMGSLHRLLAQKPKRRRTDNLWDNPWKRRRETHRKVLFFPFLHQTGSSEMHSIKVLRSPWWNRASVTCSDHQLDDTSCINIPCFLAALYRALTSASWQHIPHRPLPANFISGQLWGRPRLKQFKWSLVAWVVYWSSAKLKFFTFSSLVLPLDTEL